MATSEENDLIGYDPLAWMEGNGEKQQIIDSEYCDDGVESKLEESQLIDNEVNVNDAYSENAEEVVVLGMIEEDEVITTEIEDESDSSVLDETVADSSVSEETENAQLDLEPTLSIQHVVDLHEKLKNILAIHDEIEINASDVASIDTATLQLLVSLKKDAVKLQKTVTIIYPSPRFVESARLLGLLDVLEVQDS